MLQFRKAPESAGLLVLSQGTCIRYPRRVLCLADPTQTSHIWIRFWSGSPSLPSCKPDRRRRKTSGYRNRRRSLILFPR